MAINFTDDFEFFLPHKYSNQNDYVEYVKDDDLVKLTECILVYVNANRWKLLASSVFLSSLAEYENIQSQSSKLSLEILSILRKWKENAQDSATKQNLMNILDQENLIQVKELWWSKYYDSETTKNKDQYLKSRSDLIEKIVSDQSLDDKQWFSLVKKLRCEELTSEQTIEKLQRRNILEQWTLKHGYNKTKNSLLKHVYETVKSESLSNDVSENNSDSELFKYAIGLGYDKKDEKIAQRIKSNLKRNYSVKLFHGPDSAGVNKVEKSFEFADDCLCIFWISTSKDAQGYEKHYRQCLHHQSIKDESKRGVDNFIVLIPKEHLKNRPIPKELEAKEPLLEDEDFHKRVKVTLKRIRSKQKKKK